MSPRAVVCLTFLLTLAALPVAAVTVDDVPNPRANGRWVADTADVLSAAEERGLNQLIDRAHNDLTIEIAVVTVDDVDAKTPKQFATQLFNTWGIGSRDTNNGLLVLLVMDERRLEMETGRGLESILTDDWLTSMQQSTMVPSLKDGAYERAIYDGIERSVERVRAHPDTSEWARIPVAVWATGAAVGLGGLVGLFGWGQRRWRWRLERKCPQCNEMMRELPDAEAEDRLTSGQRMEAELGSFAWEVRVCDDCGLDRVLGNDDRHGGIWPDYHECPQCNARTLSTKKLQTLADATFAEGGRAQMKDACRHCDYVRVYEATTPRRQAVVANDDDDFDFGSGFGDSGGFGGGSSGGGGVGSSW